MGGIILGALAALFAGLNIFQMFSFRAYKKKYQAYAEKDEAMAYAEKQSALEQRLASMERLYVQQGETIDNLRKEQIKLSEEKYEREKRIVKLEGENKVLVEKVQNLSTQLEAYKTIVKTNDGQV